MTTHQLLVKARNDIARCGWKGSGGLDEGGPRCAGNALYDANGNDANEAYWAAVNALYDAAGIRDDNDFDSTGPLYRWNDHPDRTKEEVLAAFDKAIAETAPKPMDPGDLPDPDGTNVLPVPSEFFVEARASFREPVKA